MCIVRCLGAILVSTYSMPRAAPSSSSQAVRTENVSRQGQMSGGQKCSLRRMTAHTTQATTGPSTFSTGSPWLPPTAGRSGPFCESTSRILCFSCSSCSNTASCANPLSPPVQVPAFLQPVRVLHLQRVPVITPARREHCLQANNTHSLTVIPSFNPKHKISLS